MKLYRQYICSSGAHRMSLLWSSSMSAPLTRSCQSETIAKPVPQCHCLRALIGVTLDIIPLQTRVCLPYPCLLPMAEPHSLASLHQWFGRDTWPINAVVSDTVWKCRFESLESSLTDLICELKSRLFWISIEMIEIQCESIKNKTAFRKTQRITGFIWIAVNFT